MSTVMMTVDVAGVQARSRELHRADLPQIAFHDDGDQIVVTSQLAPKVRSGDRHAAHLPVAWFRR